MKSIATDAGALVEAGDGEFFYCSVDNSPALLSAHYFQVSTNPLIMVDVFAATAVLLVYVLL